MEKVRIVVVEDEIIFGEELVENLEKLGYEVFGPAISYTEGLTLFRENNPDLLLTDIGLSGKKTGLDLATVVKSERELPIIFLTSFTDKATIDAAKEIKPNAYLTKPYNLPQLYAAIELAVDDFQVKEKGETILVKTKDCFEKVKVKDILYVKSDHIYLDVYTAKKKYVIRQALTSFCEKYKDVFARVHRSFVVNIHESSVINSDSILVGGIEIPIGKNYEGEFLKRISES